MPPTESPRAALVWLFAAAAALAAAVVDLSDTHQGHHADSLVPVLTSLYHWEPFYWGSDRNGQLIPLLASPFTHPFTNLLVQFGLSVFAGIVGLGLFARLVAPACWPVVAAGAWALILFGCGEYERFNMLNPCHPYTASLACAGAGLWAAAGTGVGWARWALAAGAFVLACWVNLGLVVCLGPWLVFGCLLAGGDGPALRRVDYLRGLALLAFGTAAGMVLQRFVDCPRVSHSLLPFGRWREGATGVLADMIWHFGTNLKVSLGLLAAGAIWFVVPATRAAAVRHLPVGAAALAALTTSILGSGAMSWVANNGYSSRYIFPSLLLLNVAAVAVALGPLVELLSRPRREWFAAIGAVAVVAIPLAVYGRPSVTEARESVDRIGWIGPHAEDVLDRRCTHVCGNYWQVWPLVFRVNLALAERGESRVVWGIAGRAEPSRPKWSAVPPVEVRMGWLVLPGHTKPDANPDSNWQSAFPDLRPAERGPLLWLYVAPG